MFFGRNDAKAETPVLRQPHVKSWLIGKESDAGREWGQEGKGTTEDEMGGWHHQLNGHEFKWTLGVGDGQGGLACCDSWGHKESDMTERIHFHFSLSCIGEGNGNPLQYSCLESPRDGGAWWAAIYGVAQSQTRLKWLSSLAAAYQKPIAKNESLYGSSTRIYLQIGGIEFKVRKYIYIFKANWFLTRVPRSFNRKIMVFSAKDAETTG